VSIRIAIAQCAPALGAVKRNLDMHQKWIARARAAGARLVIFPELSLTGYYSRTWLRMWPAPPTIPSSLRSPKHRGTSTSAPASSSAPPTRSCTSRRALVGRKLVHVHRKVYLPTYGIFDDGRYFGPGDRFETYTWAGGTTGVAICEDLWHVSTPYLYAAAGATIVLAPSASPGRGVAEGGDLGTAESCRLMDRFYASYLTLYVVYVNRVGHEDGSRSGRVRDRRARWHGRGARPRVRRGPSRRRDRPELVARERARNPLLRDEREDIVLRNIAGRLGLPFDRRD